MKKLITIVIVVTGAIFALTIVQVARRTGVTTQMSEVADMPADSPVTSGAPGTVAPRFIAEPKFDAVMTAYFDVGDQLAADRLDGVAAKAATLALCANGELGSPARALVAAANDNDIATARKQYRKFSSVLVDYVGVMVAEPAGVGRKVYCPMYPGTWLQRSDTKDVVNPYYGSEMLHCGSFEQWAVADEKASDDG